MSDPRRGFTLLEVVLAMTALALVTAICYGAFHLGIRAVERGEVAVVTAQRLRAATDVIIRQIKSTVPYPARNEEEEEYPYFVGSATSMTFVTAAGLEGGGGLRRVVYQVLDNPPRLVLAEHAHFNRDSLGRDPVDEPGARAAVLLDGFRSLKFEYMLNDGVDTEWRESWDAYEEEMLPGAVRVLIEGLPGMEMPLWGQEIPLMLTTYGDNAGELSDLDESESQPDAEAVAEEGEDAADEDDEGDE
jgi:general secretion pathway protein J